MIEKKDWENMILQLEAIIKNDTMTHEVSNFQFEDRINSYNKSIEFCKKKISEFPDDKPSDPMPDALKEIVSEVSK